MAKLRAILDLLKLTAVDWWNDNTFRMAAALAFYTIFSLAPVLLIAISITGFVYGREHATQQIVDQFRLLIGEQGAQAIAQVAAAAGQSGGGIISTIIGIVTLLIGSTAVFAELQAALNQIWDVQATTRRGVILDLLTARLRSFAIVLALGFLLLVSLVFSAILAAAQESFSSGIADVAWLWQLVSGAILLLLVSALFAMIYKYLPDVQLTWRDVAIGAVVTAILFTAGKYAIGVYLGRIAVGSAYGAAGSFVVLVVWVYYSALISFFGAEFTQVYARRYGSQIRPEPFATRLGQKPDQV